MAVIPKKLSFQLRFRNKTKTRKILSRDFRLQELLKKNSKSFKFYKKITNFCFFYFHFMHLRLGISQLFNLLFWDLLVFNY